MAQAQLKTAQLAFDNNQALVNKNFISQTALIKKFKDAATVRKVIRMVDASEYKRRQAPPGVKITSRATSRDRRYPIINLFRDAGAVLPEPDRALLKAGAASKSEAFDF